jgi:hypothetical protein
MKYSELMTIKIAEKDRDLNDHLDRAGREFLKLTPGGRKKLTPRLEKIIRHLQRAVKAEHWREQYRKDRVEARRRER